MTVPKNIQLWLDALRSGDYEQGVGMLDQGCDKYCCLGVACQVAKDNGIEVLLDFEGKLTGTSLVDQPHVHEWLGLAHTSGKLQRDAVFDTTTRAISLVSLNDSLGYSFEQIADCIEEYLQDLVATEENNNDRT